MSKTTDERGRIHLPEEVRESFGRRYRIVELPHYVALLPVDDDPLEAVREAVEDETDIETVNEKDERTLEKAHILSKERDRSEKEDQ